MQLNRAIQVSFVRALGRLRHGPAFDAIVRRLGDGDVRPHAVEALGDLGDKRAIAGVTYDSSSNTVTVTPAAALPANTFFQLVINGSGRIM